MMRRLLLPRDILAEAGVNPLPVAGWRIRHHARSACDACLRVAAPRCWTLPLRPNAEW